MRSAAALAALGIVMLVIIGAPAAVAAEGGPVAVNGQAVEGDIVLSWLPPEGASAEINQTGCDSMNMSMSYVYQDFSALYNNITVTLRGGGNDLGFARWIAGESDINQASRAINPEERRLAESKGMNITETKVAVESVAVIADPRSGVSELSFEQLKGLFNGSINNWDQVGGTNLQVRTFIPPAEGSPYLFFTKSVMGTSPYATSTAVVEKGRDLVEQVASSSGGIGFVRAGLVNGSAEVDVVPIRNAAGPVAYAGTDMDASYNGSYPLARYYYLYTDGPLTGARATWASFILDAEHGQRVLADNGFLPLREADRANSTANIASSETGVMGYRVSRTSPDGSSSEFNVSTNRFVDANVTAGTYTYTVSAVYAEGQASAPPVEVTVSEPGGTGTSSPAYFGVSAWTLAALGLGAALIAAVVAVLVRRR